MHSVQMATRDQKRQLLDFVSSNCVLSDKKVVYNYNNPFDLAVKTKTQTIEKPENNSDRPDWLRRQDSNFTTKTK